MKELLSTNTGWLLRQGLKLITIAGASITAWLVSKDVAPDKAEGITVGVVTLLSWLLELGLSNIAKKVAVPMLAVACLTLPSCTTDPTTGEKSFLGFTSKSFTEELKVIGLELANATTQAAAQAVLDVAEAKLTEAETKLAANTDTNPLVVLALTKGAEQAQNLVMQARLKVASFRFGKQPIDVQP